MDGCKTGDELAEGLCESARQNISSKVEIFFFLACGE